MAGGILFALGGLLTAKLLSPSRPNPEKLSTYECGEDPVGNARIQINIRFYVVALLFLLFEVELIFLFPWATLFGNKALLAESGWFLLAQGIFFLLILTAGLAYAWMRGDLDWKKAAPILPQSDSPIPFSEYIGFNQQQESRNPRA